MAKKSVKRITVVYVGPANVYINFPTRERPDGYAFVRDVPVDIPAAMWPLVEAVGPLFERVLPDPEPLPSIPESVVDAVPVEETESVPSVPEPVVDEGPVEPLPEGEEN